MSKKYKNSPIIEAICEFQFEENSAWDLTVPGLVYGRVQNEFPIRRQAARVTMGIHSNVGNITPQFGAVHLMQFLRRDEKALMQIGSHILSINLLNPYPSWTEFLPLIQTGFNEYCNVAKPTGLQRIGLRYINHIEIPDQNARLEDCFEFRPFTGPKLPQKLDSFVLGGQIAYENSRDILSLQLASSPRLEPSIVNPAVILSLDYFLAKPKGVLLDEALTWIEKAHENIEDIFEGCITDRLRALFKGEAE
jgi:uncharacterized protein (TIGR04255 family)